MRGLLLFVTLLFSQTLISQCDSSEMSSRKFGSYLISGFDPTPDSTVYNAMQQYWNANLPVSYISIPFFGHYTKSIERVGGLILGEGMNGYIIEGITDQNYILNQGRRQNRHWEQTFRFAFKYAPGVRMTQDNSSNLLPTNQKVGFQIDKVIWDDFTNIFFTESEGKTEINEAKNFFDSTKGHTSVNFSLIVMHYSNGQASGVFRDQVTGRNDYIKGDFSTNVVQPTFTLNHFNKKKELLSANIGYQFDGNLYGPLEYIPEQKYRYGNHRVVGYLQWRSKPSRNIVGATKRMRGLDGCDYKVRRMWEYRVRWEYEHILGNMDSLKRSKDYRFNWHLYLEGQPMRSRTIGYFMHLYRGRDYFNIRYDDMVWIFNFGFSFTINRYKNPRFHPNSAIKGFSDEEPKFYQQQQEQRLK
jgi:hypothetical protein